MTIDVSIVYGWARLQPYDWVQDGLGCWGQRYERIDYDRSGVVVARKVLEPVCWLTTH